MSTNLLQNPSVHGPSRQIQGLRLGFGLGGLDRAFGTSGFPHLDGARVQWFAWIREPSSRSDHHSGRFFSV